jgi:tetratricopeptide (TPR) repeat protein
MSEAAHAYTQADRLREQLTNLDPENSEWQRKLASVRANLGMVELSQGRDESGRERIRQAQERRLSILNEKEDFAAARRDLAMGYYMLAKCDSLVFYDLPEPRPVEKATPIIANLREAIKHFELLRSDDLVNRYRLATAYRQLGGLLTRSGQIQEAADAYKSARPLTMALAFGNPDVREYQNEYVGLAMNQGALFDAQNDIPQAMDAWVRAKDFLADLIARDPNDFNHHYDLAQTLDAIAEDYRLTDNLPQHVATLEEVEREIAILIAASADEATRDSLRTWQAQVAADRWLAQVIVDVRQSEQIQEEETELPTPSSLSPEPADKNE